MAARPDEFSLIEKYFTPLSGAGSFGLKDDAAILDIPKGKSLVITNDAIAEGVHFLPGTDPKLIAQKAIRTNLSDLAAKGATPFSFSLALGLHSGWHEKWISGFAKGLESDCKQFGLSLCGGDTFQSAGGATVAITAYGHISKKDYASRLGAKFDDHLYVTGTIGDSVLGLGLASERKDKTTRPEKFLLNRYELPQPRVEMARHIAKFASSAMDISDGFVGDLDKICNASGVSVSVPSKNIPFSSAARSMLKNNKCNIGQLITGGDDYELLVTVPKTKAAAFEKAVATIGFPVTYLGGMESANKGAVILDETGKAIEFSTRSYVHFKD